jgi:ribosome recycling factor
MQEVFDFAREHMQKSIDVLKKDLNTLRTGRVSIHVLDGVKVEYYGAPTPLNQVANINAVDATTIVISPWDKGIINDIEKAIQEANVGANPNNDGDTIKLYFPPMTEEERKKQAKKAKEFGEKAKIAIRNIRREANDEIKKMFKNKEITEDDQKRGLDEVQKITDEFVAKVDEIVNKKIDDVMRV